MAPEGLEVPRDSGVFAGPVAYVDVNGERMEMGHSMEGEIVSDVGGCRCPVPGLADLVPIEGAKGPELSERDAAFAGHRDSECDCDYDWKYDGDEEDEDDDEKDCGSDWAAAAAWLQVVLIPCHLAAQLLEEANSDALERAALVALEPSKDARFVDIESHQLDIVNRIVEAEAEVDVGFGNLLQAESAGESQAK